MAIKVTDAGGQNMLNVIFGATAKQAAFTLQLFTDSTALADADTNATHTVATGGGYADKTLSNNATVSLNGGIPEAVWGAQVFTFTGALTTSPTIKGYQAAVRGVDHQFHPRQQWRHPDLDAKIPGGQWDTCIRDDYANNNQHIPSQPAR